MNGEEIADAALALVGVPFRLHGRDPRIALDCLGLVAAATDNTANVPARCSPRSLRRDRADAIACALGLVPTSQTAAIAPGDVLMFEPAPCHHHLAVALDPHRIVHAHAGLGRVALGPIPADWPITGHWHALPSKE